MRHSTKIKSISYVKANVAEILDQLTESRDPLIVAQNGEAKAVLQDVRSYEEMRETLALLRITALADEDIASRRAYACRRSR
ncbi:type II toxin-antitoxin system Phd/YefM family antitoxin [uncultured Sphingomonas sp.]|uniref:type II toxin-antitoxin system Phd/YefM family antitoxin n=1 Tax=uncultured Sphingomonas sp. TaxID=158754 RepID=UPI0025E32EB9|nr:type II toxin-antitoxin system Phd/YefM family antitoxin [uncultured Sphingomonas sp.]